MYCAWRIPAHLRCTQCLILLHLLDICFLTCICLWQISQILTRLFKVVGPGLVSTSAAFAPLMGAGRSTQFAQQLVSAVTVPRLVGRVVLSCLLLLQPPVAHPLTILFLYNLPMQHLQQTSQWIVTPDANLLALPK